MSTRFYSNSQNEAKEFIMSRRDDDDIWALIAFYWLMHEDTEEEKRKQEEQGEGCLFMMGIITFMVLAINEHPIATFTVIGALIYWFWKYCQKKGISFVRIVFSVIGSIFGGTILIEMIFSMVYSFYRFNSISTTAMMVKFAIYVGVYIYMYRVVCPWLTAKAKEIAKRKK